MYTVYKNIKALNNLYSPPIIRYDIISPLYPIFDIFRVSFTKFS